MNESSKQSEIKLGLIENELVITHENKDIAIIKKESLNNTLPTTDECGKQLEVNVDLVDNEFSITNRNKGIACIKKEFIIEKYEPKLAVNCISETDKSKINEDEPPSKKQKCSKSVLKGQNKSRNCTYSQNVHDHLCSNLVEGTDKGSCPYDNCKFLHDVKQYLEKKPDDIDNTCYVYSLKGRCPRGLTCRFGRNHIKNEANVVDQDKYDIWIQKESSCKSLGKENMFKLRKKTYDFTKSNEAVKKIDNNKNIGPLIEENARQINWNNKLYLAPLTTVGNLPFRRICKEYGADITCSEMVLSSSLLQGHNQEWALTKRHESEDLFGVQICGNNPYMLTKSAQVLQENVEMDFLDLNLGCPLDQIYRQGAGSGLLLRNKKLEVCLKSMRTVLDVPLTVKTRSGVSKDQNLVHELIPMFKDSGVSLVTVHGRSREQRYTKMADWKYVNECAKLASPIPVFSSGDVMSYEDYENSKIEHPEISGAMIGRGALIKPWIFREIKEKRHWDISSSERFDMLKKFVNYGLEHWGSDTRGVETTRRFLLEWLSFCYRYIPVGILECVPQKVNERPPNYRGRNDLETIMASGNCADWIEISKMLLGPVPDGFQFLPKHKANSWK
ncbi:tRNA-dihydrouridine(47) synthase [NAD(P)(+)]-like [Adelges cooleyi]|uniref:tRNA-dihydrouridine(47) synthase [NAD(P)(+)]-like n=1 Tax=Adelges cooleyi TaxID=133065 RepID=UPI00217FA65D|nr:tRNA-dihydrouridine(47) synthase [NAD(P)(+)]-like [Adelges cooleyi]